MTKRELSRQTPDCVGAKLIITSTALRAYRNRHLGTLMRCCVLSLSAVADAGGPSLGK